MFCHNCGAKLKDTAKFCHRCGARAYDPAAVPQEPPAAPKNYPAFGILGAFLGAVLGGTIQIVCSQMGIYSAFDGFLLSVLTILGYYLLGKKRSASGTVVVTLLILSVPYLADVVDWALVILRSLETSYHLLHGIWFFYGALADGTIPMEMYLQDVLALYGFTALGAITAFSWTTHKEKTM